MAYKNITIRNYRGIEELTLGFSPHFNLLIGDNGVGKTSVLESLSILSGVNNPPILFRGQNARGIPVLSEEDLKSMFRGDGPIVYEGEFHSGQHRSMTVEITDISDANLSPPEKNDLVVGEVGASMLDRQKIIIQDATVEGENVKVFARFTKEGVASGTISGSYREALRVVIDSGLGPGGQVNLEKYGKLVAAGKKGAMVEKLKGIIEPRLLSLDQANNRVLVGLEGVEDLLQVENLGAGFVRALNLLSVLLEEEVKVFLIDEIENGLHHSIKKELLRTCFRISIETGVQIIATTHDDEILKVCHSLLEEEDEFAGLREGTICNYLIRSKKEGEEGAVKAFAYDFDAVSRHIKVNLEIR